jgi:hypothetical protein
MGGGWWNRGRVLGVVLVVCLAVVAAGTVATIGFESDIPGCGQLSACQTDSEPVSAGLATQRRRGDAADLLRPDRPARPCKSEKFPLCI